MKVDIRLIYLYLFSFVGLLITVFGFIRLTELALKIFVFKDADRPVFYEPSRVAVSPEGKPMTLSTEEAMIDEEKIRKNQEDETKRQRERDIAGSLSMIVVGAPLYYYHWRTIQKEHKKQT